MKKMLSLLLSFTIGFLGLVSVGVGPVRAQTLASVAPLSKLREQYERLLAVEHDPSTSPEVREVNHTILEERRAQLAEALRKRIDALRVYRTSLVTTLTAEEKTAVEGSIQQLVDELQRLQPARNTPPADGARPSRRPLKATQNSQMIQQASFGGDAEKSDDSATVKSVEPTPAPAAIDITSPDSDKTVHVGEIEMEVNINDQDVDNIMVAVYTQSSGQKPATARTLELKRSDRGKKSFPVALEVGVNRIEISDLKQGGVLATRTLTYLPARDILNAPPRAEPTATPVKSLVVQKLEAGENASKVVICGQLQLSSLNRTFALIRSTPALGDLAARFRPADSDPRRGSEDQAAPTPDFLIVSQISDDCTFNNKVMRDGLQRAAAIDLLSAVLLRLDSHLNPKPTDINRTALRNETAYLLENTTTELRIKRKARGMRGAPARSEPNDQTAETAAETAADQTADQAVSDYAKLEKSSAFSSLSADTIRKQIVLLQQYLGNVEVRLTHDNKVIDQTLTDRDGNFVFTITTPTDTDDKEYTISTEGDEHFTTRVFTKDAIVDKKKLRVNLDIEDRPVSLLARSLIGFSQSGAAASKRDWNYFFDFYVSKSFPFHQKINPDFGERLRLWGDWRIDSLPQSADVTVSDFAGTGFTTGIKNLKVKDVARVFEFLGGVEYRLTGNNALLPSFDRQTKQKFSLSFIAAGGFVTPLVPQETAPTIFTVFADAPGLPPAAKGKEFVAFVPSDRDRFFRQYYVGLRVQTFFFNKYNIPLQRFPAQFDVTVGQNEFVTGGRFHGPVVRMEGFFPLPFEPVKFINLFATAQMIPGRPNIGTPLILQEAPSTVTVPAANVALIAVPQPNRDHYRIGISFDAIPLIKRIFSPPVPSTPSTNTNSGGNTNGNTNGNSNSNTNSNSNSNHS